MDAIDGALRFLEEELNTFLINTHGSQEKMATLSNIVTHDGRPYDTINNKLVMTVYNITRKTETAGSAHRNVAQSSDMPLDINLHVALLANFSNQSYHVGLGMIAKAMSFFHCKPHFNAKNSPAFPSILEAINVEAVNLSEAEVNCVMSTLGTKYLPSIFYNIRL